ncbi:MAG: UDP-glucose 4-epimerase GalE [Syntrophales bacterium]
MILVTGGAGYIGSHTCIELIAAGFELVVFDNLSNASSTSLQRLETITGKIVPFVKGDIRSHADLAGVFDNYQPEAVIHFAGLKAVGESVTEPLLYYNNNLTGTICLLETMQEFGCKTIVFSSSATVYGDPHTTPIREDFPLAATNPYGRTKLMIEEMLGDLFTADNTWRIARLRYFNPVGAHVSGLIGEDPHGIPNNLMPYISQVAVGKRAKLNVFGGDYDTPDGTGVRDYIHVVDLARGHLKALEALTAQPRLLTVNLGTGKGYSVLEMVRAFEKSSGREVPYEIVARRPGDVAKCYADPSLAKSLLGWEAQFDLERMCSDSWRWQSMNPNGYADAN